MSFDDFPKHVSAYYRSIDKTHMGLGGYIFILQSCELALQSTKLDALTGMGKTTILDSLYALKFTKKDKKDFWNTFTFDEMYEKLGILRNCHITMLIDDLISFTGWHMELFCKVIPSLISEFGAKYRHKMGDSLVDIDKCTCTCHIGIQPRKDADLISRQTDWVFAAGDRILPIALMNPLMDVSDEKEQPLLPKIKKIEPLTKNLKDIGISADTTCIKKSFGKYFTMQRRKLRGNNFARALASMLHEEVVNEYVVDFARKWLLPLIDLYEIFMTPGGEFGGYMSLRSKELAFFQYVALCGPSGVSRSRMAKDFKVEQKTVSNVASKVKALGLITNRSIDGQRRYVITGKYANFFFNRYRGLYE